jgi:hypothetical protein
MHTDAHGFFQRRGTPTAKHAKSTNKFFPFAHFVCFAVKFLVAQLHKDSAPEALKNRSDKFWRAR